MPVRGKRAIWPKEGKKPTGIFSSRGRQKDDPNDPPAQSLREYAHSRNRRGIPSGSGDQSLRHQPPKKIW